MLPRQQQRVLAAPAQTRFRGKRHFQHRRAVAEHAAIAVARCSTYLLRQLLQPVAQHLVIVPPQRIARNKSAFAVLDDLPRIPGIVRVIIHPHRYHAQGTRDQFRRTAAFAAVFCHIIHHTVITQRQPLLHTCLGFAQLGIADAHSLKTQFATPLLDLGSQVRVIDLLRKFVLHKPDNNRSGVSRHSAARPELAINLPDEAATAAFAARLSRVLTPGLVLYLRGDLGAGKTTLVRALLNALGYQGRVKSPTYTLLEQYEAGGLNLRHFDLYRFQDASEWESAGFGDEFDAVNICLVEWPDKAADLIPPADMEIIFDILPDGRNISLQAHTDTGRECLNSLEK